MKVSRTIPRSVEWSAALFVGIAIFESIVQFGSTSPAEWKEDWPFYIVRLAIYGGIARAVWKGVRWIRPFFVIVAAIAVLNFLAPSVFIRLAIPEVWRHGVEAAAWLAVLLCFLPPSAVHFHQKKENGFRFEVRQK